MEGTYPIIVGGAVVGTLTVGADGAGTRFDAECQKLAGIVRLSVYGGDREGYLGVLAPEGDGLSLHKKFSRAALRDFPTVIEAVGPAGQTRTPIPEPVPEPPQPEAAPVPEEPLPAPAPERYWYAATDGALLCFDGEKNLMAIPADDPRIPENAAGEKCTVEGRGYLVFPTENGRIVWY